MLDAERASGRIWTPEEIQEFGGDAVRSLSAAQIEAIRIRRSQLLEQWAAVPPGSTLELAF